MMFMFLQNLKPQFDQVEKGYKEKSAINLSATTSKKDLSDLLYNNGYVENSRDAKYIADTLVDRLKRQKFSNLYDLQKRAKGKIPMVVADSAKVLTNKVELSKMLVGLGDSLEDLPDASTLKTRLSLGNGDGEMKVVVTSDSSSNCGGVVIQLIAYYKQSDTVAKDTSYLKTDSSGCAQITGMNRDKGYSVLPIRYGYEYGSSKGVKCGNFKKYRFFNKFWRKEYVYTFEQQEHRIQMIGNAMLKQIKNDGTLTVRTPAEYKAIVVKWFVFVLLAWWTLCLILMRRKKNFDQVLIASVMFLTGFCVLTMFSIQNPLTEDLRGVDMAKGVIIGIIIAIALQFVDFVKFYQEKSKAHFDIPIWLFLPFKRKISWLAQVMADKDTNVLIKLLAGLGVLLCTPLMIFDLLQIPRLLKNIEKAPKGTGWLLLALLLTALLWTPLGNSIGGMKVNLKLGPMLFQPSEIAKYLILLFMAAFFTQRADTIINYSRPARNRVANKLWSKTKTLGWVIGGLMALMAMYVILGDMGPGLVIGVTFVLLYSLVKSKVNLENLNEEDKWRKIFTCDFAMLIYGVVSFAVFILAGKAIGNSLLGAVLWFVAWIVWGSMKRRQFFETAFTLNILVFVFIFGGQIMQSIPPLANMSVAERFEERIEMCENPWGDLDIEGKGDNAKAVSNTQVANGLWALATGGLTGQGLGDGNPNLIPAFHTDMILSSIGEQVGWIGLFFVVLVLALLLRRVVVVGYRVGHPFAFYFCTGVAIVTGVQFFIIALGSSGIIPLTGVTVPFLSYGRVSMILNLTALGVVVSLSQNIKTEQAEGVEKAVRLRSVGEYNYPASIISWTFVVLALFTLGVWQYYGFWNRSRTLVHPAFVYNNQGTPLIEYNPRIALLTKEMWAGDIYDRKGMLLATSDREKLDSYAGKYDSCGLDIKNLKRKHPKRYYPFGEHLFFMLGDINNGLYFTYDEDNPIGYMAEAQHLAYLRDYDNVLRDSDGNAIKVNLKDTTQIGGKYIDAGGRDTIMRYVVRDNSDLTKYLKSGIHGRAVKRHNKRVSNGKYDLKLTLDAVMQTEMQNKLINYVEKDKSNKYRRSGLENNHHLRVSVVVLDADNGDLLTSANYPLPDYQRVREEDESGNKYYNDNRRPNSWTAYTDRDLGLTNATAPGSTAKIMSAMAGLNKKGTTVGSNTKFDIQLYEVIDYNGHTPVEPPMNGNTHEWVDMRRAIVVSSNCYFINLVNDYDLYKELEKIYKEAGIRLEGKAVYNLHYHPDTNNTLDAIVNSTRSDAINSWKKYQNDKSKGLYVNGKNTQTLKRGEWMWAWGQGTLDATPLSMARVVSAVVNNGAMPQTRYIMSDETKMHTLTSKTNAQAIKSFMRGQYEDNSTRKNHLIRYETLGGKTGTPHRTYTGYKQKKGSNKNDGWYVFYVDNKSLDKSKHNIAVAVRMERIGISGGSSTDAMWLSREVVIPTLKQYGYIVE